MDDYKQFQQQFLANLDGHAVRKLKQWRNMGEMLTYHELLGLCTEELGEIATILNENGKGKTQPEQEQRLYTECIDLAHTAMLLAFKINLYARALVEDG